MDTPSIMVYSPLFPSQSDVVELAELVPVDIESSKAVSWWPLSLWNGQGQESACEPPQRTWVPSSSKISVQAFWWGYRLYLPPPILEVLSDKTLEAAKRSAVITTALTWFFNNLPVQVFPPPMQPVLVLLQQLVPLLGYIGAFISWSWSTIKGYDVGYGVTLTATWILPVALIPGTWHERDFPKSPTPNSPISLPRSPFSMQSPTPTTSTDDDDIPTSAYVTPMASVAPLGENGMLDPSLASSSTAWSASPPQLPTSSPIYYPTTAPTPTFMMPLTLSPRIHIPRFRSRMKSSSPFINSNNSNGTTTTTLIHDNNISSRQHPDPSTPIPIPPAPIELPPIPPEPPFSPKLVNQLLRGPVLQTVPLPDVG